MAGDSRLYLPVTVYGKKFTGLLDAGASGSVVGGPGWEILKVLDVKLLPTTVTRAKIADGNYRPVIGRLDLPIGVNGRIKVHPFYVSPEIKRAFNFGIDFWKQFGILHEVLSNSCEITTDEELVVDEIVVVARDKLNRRQETKLKAM